MEELLEKELQLKQILSTMKQEEIVLEDKLNAIRTKINNDKSKLKEILEEKEELMIENDKFLDDIIGFELDGVKYVPAQPEPSMLMSMDMCETHSHIWEYDISSSRLSLHLAYRFVEATKKWIATKASNPNRILLPQEIFTMMANDETIIVKTK